MYVRQLGFGPLVLPVATTVGPSLLDKIGDIGSGIRSIFGGGGPNRNAAIDNRKALALQGDMGSLAVLKCWAGMPAPELNNYPELAADVGVNTTGSNCGMATADAKAYAKAAYEYVIAARSGQDPSTRPPTVPAGGMSPLVLLAGAAVLVLVLKGRK